ncbi:CONSTANS-like zinc finger protein [Quillaja saponaria]|uniref:CONSTANS-like zinc finger protein n=1 Tax=Quillaja saponaria TaxID=32244 RepID=A0AAD7Q1H2_QUISA|nr:CONSTANS-like zinc finger protein [Quillaja saponaria]KAJ7972902.1 CONSTANS-like zinc finger protein [Quillaja saponaria]
MSDSLRHPNLSCKDEAPQLDKDQNSRLCDYCGDSTALLYCRADSAKLCFSCDREVHSTNQLFSKHTRSQLCDACDASPATIHCSTENSVFCQNCDWERHNLSLSEVHDRRPLEGFTGCPSVTELLTIVGFDDVGNKALFLTDSGDAADGFLGSEFDGLSEFLGSELVSDTPSIVSLDDLIVSTNSPHNYNAMEVPPMPKNRRAAGGRHKEELLNQLRQFAKTEPNLNYGDNNTERLNGRQYLVPEQCGEPGNFSTGFKEHGIEAEIFPSYEAGDFQWHNDSGEPVTHAFLPNTSLRSCPQEVPGKHSFSDVCGNHVNDQYGGQSQNLCNSENLSPAPRVAPYELTSQERDSAISRYKEKRKTRRYDKHVRYETRKVRAESRTRIKGRFAKMDR